MNYKDLISQDPLYNYLHSICLHEPELAQELRSYTIQNCRDYHMMTTPEQAQFMALIAKVTNTRNYLEIGTYTGYSTFIMAQAILNNLLLNNNNNKHTNLSPKIITIDKKLQNLEIAKNYWQAASIDIYIEAICLDAEIALRDILEKTNSSLEPLLFDIVYIDANKSQYQTYYELTYKLLKQNGIMFIDNVFMGYNKQNKKAKTYQNNIHDFNLRLKNDTRVQISTIPFAGGLTMLYKL